MTGIFGQEINRKSQNRIFLHGLSSPGADLVKPERVLRLLGNGYGITQL